MFPDLTTDLLRRGSHVRFRAVGASMQPTIEDGELITVAPVGPESVRRGEILLYQNERGVFAHRVVRTVKGTFPYLYLLRGDAAVECDPPVSRAQVIGRVVAVQRGTRSLALDHRMGNLLRLARLWISKFKAFRLVHLIYRKCIKIP